MKRLILVLSLLAALCSATVSSAAGNTDHVDAATSVLLVGSDGKAAVPTGATGPLVQINQSGVVAQVYNSADGQVDVNGLGVHAQPQLFNGATWDRQYNNLPSATVGITCAACSSTQTGSDQTNFNGRGVRCTYDATIVTSLGSFTVEIDGKDEVSGKYIALLTGAARTTVGTDTLTVYPGITATANVSASMVVPRTWRVKATFNSGTNQTFTIGCNTLV